MLRSLLLLTLASAPAVAQDAVPADELAAARRWAVVIGNSEYDFLPDLKFARDDAKAFARALIDGQGFAADTVRLLTDDAENEFQRPTRAYIMRELRGLLKDARRTPSDLFVFYFSGHGVGLEDGDYLLPKSADLDTVGDVGLEVGRVVEILREAGVANALFVMDGCREGEKNTPFGQGLLELPQDQRVAVFLSCEPGAQSLQSRRLGHGIFTWYFLQALEQDELHDPSSGALWASSVGEYVRDKVREHTELETVPQVPRVFVDDTRDVLLGARIPPDLDPEGIARFAAEVGVSIDDPLLYMGTMGTYAEFLFRRLDYAQCAAVLNAAAERGQLPPHLQYLHGASLMSLGRAREASRVIDALCRAHAETYWGRLAAVQDFTGTRLTSERRAAALEMLERDRPLSDSLVSHIIYVLLRGGAQSDALEWLETLAAELPAEHRLKAFLEATVAVERGEVERALEAYARAGELQGAPETGFLWLEHSEVLLRFGRVDEALAVLDRAVEATPERGDWRVRRAHALERVGRRASARDEARAALELPLDASALLLAVRILGADVRASTAAIRARAAEHPLAWEARIAEIVATKKDAEIGTSLWDVQRYGSSSAQVVVAAAKVYRAIARELREKGEMTREEELTHVAQCVYELAQRAPEFGLEVDAWSLFEQLTTDMGSFVQLREMCDRHLGPFVASGELPARLVITYAFACLNTGDLARFRELRALLAPDSKSAIDLAWYEAAYLATQGDTAGARAVSKELQEPEAGLGGAIPLLRALLAAQEGDGETAVELLQQAGGYGVLGHALAAQTLMMLSREDLAEPMVQEMLVFRGTPFSFAQLASVATFIRGYGSLAHYLDFAQRCATHHPGNPLLRRVSFADETSTAAFAGLLRFKVHVDDREPGKLLLVIEEDGSVEGSLRSADGQFTWSVVGKIDEYGNLDARMSTQQVQRRILAKLAPAGVYEEHALLREYGQTLLVVSEDGVTTPWTLLP